MRRRTFLTSATLGAAFTAVPLATLTSSPAWAAETRVSTLRDLQTAIDGAAPGDRIVVADGAYAVPQGGAIRVTGKHGADGAPITIVAASRGGAVLTGEHGFVFSDSSHIVVSGFAFRQRATLEIPANCPHIRLTRNDFGFADVSGVHWLVIRGNHAKIDRNHFHDKATAGVFLAVDGPGTTAIAFKTHILRNHFSDHTFPGSNGGEAVRIGVSSRALSTADATVEYNLFERCDGDPEAISVKSSGNTIQYNTLRTSHGGIVLRHGNNSKVVGNYLLGGTEGLRIYGNDHVLVNNYCGALTGRPLVIGSGTLRDHLDGESAGARTGNDACDRALIAHNTLAYNARGISGESRTHEPRDVTVADNLLVGDQGSLVSLQQAPGFVWQGNILWGAASNGTIPSVGFTRTDPKLVQGTDTVFRLSSTSPAIGAATLTTLTLADDIDGHTRGTTRDVGADEYATTAPLRRPLTTADVGPNAA
ncbi:polysaccharide lyase 6 family protein [Streptomyces sp. NPDC057638]|uniref:polysaccharide lyase 6 family protein n=1 Tax=Streptomyces sp. NPDC057638 TaxID=3346190 RepID=UPI003695B915